MRIGLVTDSLAHLGLDELLDTAAAMGVEGIELNTCNWSTAPHCDLAELLASGKARRDLLIALQAHGLDLIALNANGNQLHPVDGRRQADNLRGTITLAAELGVPTVVCMSGLPGGGPHDRTPNWVVTSWPPENAAILRWQWEERLLPFWRDLAALAERCGVRLAVEMHGAQLVYDARTLLRLRAETGAVVGANLDPSHPMWMGGDPLAIADHLGAAIHHVHAKDTYLDAHNMAITSRLETGPLDDLRDRSWWHATVGVGHPEDWWREFCYRLRLNGYDGWLSIEHEDANIGRVEGVRRAVELLRRVAPVDPHDYAVQEV